MTVQATVIGSRVILRRGEFRMVADSGRKAEGDD